MVLAPFGFGGGDMRVAWVWFKGGEPGPRAGVFIIWIFLFRF
jgi:hypothetical protein